MLFVTGSASASEGQLQFYRSTQKFARCNKFSRQKKMTDKYQIGKREFAKRFSSNWTEHLLDSAHTTAKRIISGKTASTRQAFSVPHRQGSVVHLFAENRARQARLLSYANLAKAKNPSERHRTVTVVSNALFPGIPASPPAARPQFFRGPITYHLF